MTLPPFISTSTSATPKVVPFTLLSPNGNLRRSSFLIQEDPQLLHKSLAVTSFRALKTIDL